MRLLKRYYERKKGKPAPYYYNYSLFQIVCKPFRKWIAQVVAPNCISNKIRIMLYRLCGFRIGKHVFIGMKCYLDDMCFDLLTIGNNVTISYGVYFACHGKNQEHYPIQIGDYAYVGMRASIISKNRNGSEDGIRIGKEAIIGACSLVNIDVPEGATVVGVPCRIVKTQQGVLDDKN